MADDREKALEAGCDDYDAKPIEMPRLLKVEALLGKKATSSASPRAPSHRARGRVGLLSR